MSAHQVVSYAGAGVLYLVMSWGLITGYRSGSDRLDAHYTSVRALVVPFIYLLVVTGSILLAGGPNPPN